MESREVLTEAKERLARAVRPLVLTGAGISAESGVPTFRGSDGLWRQYSAQDLATPQAFSRNPGLVWEWYQWRRRLIAGAIPNDGHLALVRLEERSPEFLLITQNVDGLHRRAGSRKLLEIHGSIWRTRCTQCLKEEENWDLELSPLPACDKCGGLLRPDVVWFGEALDPGVIEEAFRAASACDLILVVGTSGVVRPAADLPLVAKQRGAQVIEVNPEDTPITGISDLALRGKAAELLPVIIGPPFRVPFGPETSGSKETPSG